MTVSNLSFSATLPPFYQTTGFASNYSKTNLSVAGNLGIAKTTDPHTGKDTTTVSSSVSSNGINFVSNGSTQHGNLLTVNYVSDEAANSGTNSAISQNLLKTNINGEGVQFSNRSSTSHDGVVQVSYNSHPSRVYTATVESAATSSQHGNAAQNILLKSYSQVGNTIAITYQVSNGALSNNTQLANTQVPLENPSFGGVNTSPGAGAVSNGPTFDNNIGFKTIGDVLASANGLSDALHPVAVDHSTQRQQTVAAFVNTSNANTGSPTGSLSVADFIDTSINAFPTSSPSKAAEAYGAANDFLSSRNDNSSQLSSKSDTSSTNHTSFTRNSSSDTSNSNSISNNSTSTGISSSISNSNASTIRGVGVNTFA